MSLAARSAACPTCGGQVVFVGHAISEHSPYCHGPVVALDTENAYPATSLIPFAVDRDTAFRAAHDWIDSRIAKPFTLRARVAEGELVGLYAPFWTFDTTEAARYAVVYEDITAISDRPQTRRQTGEVRVILDDLLVLGSPHITPVIRDGILRGFRPGQLRAFRPGYLAGFAAEGYHQTVADRVRASAEDRRILIRDRICLALWPADTSQLTHRADTTNVRYRRILLPVWILHYRFGRATYHVAVSGIDGGTFGERPYSRVLIYGLSGLITACVMGLGMALAGF